MPKYWVGGTAKRKQSIVTLNRPRTLRWQDRDVAGDATSAKKEAKRKPKREPTGKEGEPKGKRKQLSWSCLHVLKTFNAALLNMMFLFAPCLLRVQTPVHVIGGVSSGTSLAFDHGGVATTGKHINATEATFFCSGVQKMEELFAMWPTAECEVRCEAAVGTVTSKSDWQGPW